MKEIIIKYVEENGLNCKSRHREYSYRRMFLAGLLHKEGLTLQAIADIFNRTHATIIHAIRTDQHFIKTNDSVYKMYIQKELELFAPLVEIRRDIFTEVLNARNTTDLMNIIRRIKNNEYEQQPQDFISSYNIA
tara:strand:+ start:51 stop:452 length:402 start_codon:yes stop_codon:yes gene_type:complete